MFSDLLVRHCQLHTNSAYDIGEFIKSQRYNDMLMAIPNPTEMNCFIIFLTVNFN